MYKSWKFIGQKVWEPWTLTLLVSCYEVFVQNEFVLDDSTVKKIMQLIQVSVYLISGLRRPDACSHSRQKCIRCLDRSTSQLTCRRAQKPMIRSCSEGAYNQRCIPASTTTQSFLEPEHITRVQSMDVSLTTNSETSLNNTMSPASFTDDDYNIPYKCPMNFTGQQTLDMHAGVVRSSTQGATHHARRYCRRQEVSSQEALTDSSGSSQGSPAKDEDLLPSQSNCQVGHVIFIKCTSFIKQRIFVFLAQLKCLFLCFLFLM